MQAVSGFRDVDNCGICRDPLYEPESWWKGYTQATKDRVQMLVCSHKFHLPCIQEGVNEQIKFGLSQEGKATCPICRHVIDITSSSKQISDMSRIAWKVIGTAIIIASYAISFFIASQLGVAPDSLFSLAFIIAPPVVSYYGANFMSTHLSERIFKTCLDIHTWRKGLALASEDLNFIEIVGDKEGQAELRKLYWITTVKIVIENRKEIENEITFSDALLDHLEVDKILNGVYERLRLNDPGTFATLQNAAPHSDAWQEAFDESLEQLFRDGLTSASVFIEQIE